MYKSRHLGGNNRVFHQLRKISLGKKIKRVQKLDVFLTSRRHLVQLPLHGHLNAFVLFGIVFFSCSNVLDGSRSSKEVVVFDHFLIDLGVIRLEGGFEECLSLEIGIYLFCKLVSCAYCLLKRPS